MNVIGNQTYLIFGAFMLLAVAYVYVALPETMGLSLEKIEVLFERGGGGGGSGGSGSARATSAAKSASVVANPLVDIVEEGGALLSTATPAKPAASPADRRGRAVALAAGIAMTAK